MNSRSHNEPEITALLIAPDRALADSFRSAIAGSHVFQVLAELKTYPAAQALEIRLRQLKPDVILLDLASDLNVAIDLIQAGSSMNPPARVVGIHASQESQAVLRSLRAGAVEFLCAPFDATAKSEIYSRLRRIILPEPVAKPAELGRTLAFASSKPGSGASTIATQTAFSLQRRTGKRILLADCDLTGGTIAFYLKLSHAHSIVEALQNVDRLDASAWKSLTVAYQGVDILPAPAVPFAEPVDPGRMRALAENARQYYDWVVLDLPSVFYHNSLIALTDCDQAYVVSTADLAGLHVTRKAVKLMQQLGFPQDRYQVLVNRTHREDISAADMEKLFGCPAQTRLPNDDISVHRVVTLGQPLGVEGDLGRSIERFTGDLTVRKNTTSKEGARDLKPALSGA